MPKCALCSGSKYESWTEVVFENNKQTKQQSQLFSLSLVSAQTGKKKKKNLMGKPNGKKKPTTTTTKSWRSKNAHDKEAHSNKIK